MSISAVIGASGSSPLGASDFTQRKKNLDALSSALESGDLSAAQSAFDAIQQDMQNMPKPGSVNSSTAQSSAFTQAQSDFEKIGSALSSGDVNAAKEAFAAWQKDMQQMRAQHHRGNGTDQSANSGLTLNITDTSTGTATSTFSVTA